MSKTKTGIAMRWRGVGKNGDPWPDWLRALRNSHGVYLIRLRPGLLSAGGLVYIGESHAGRLKKTCQRHFQQWGRKTINPFSPEYYKKTGAVYSRADCDVSVIPTATASRAVDLQFELIAKLKPRDNEIGLDLIQPGSSVGVEY